MANKIRINITVDRDKLEKARTKLGLFGGKLSTLFNAYLSEFVEGIGKDAHSGRKDLERKLKELESRIRKLENKNS